MTALVFDDPQKLTSAYDSFVRSLPQAMRPVAGDLPAHRNAFAKAHGARNWEDGLSRARQRQRESAQATTAGTGAPWAHHAAIDNLGDPIPFGPTGVELREHAIRSLVQICALLADLQENRFGRRPTSGVPASLTISQLSDAGTVQQLSNPIGQGLRRQIRAIGELLHEHDPDMLGAYLLYEVQERCQKIGIRRPDPMTVLDKNFNGIGGWLA